MKRALYAVPMLALLAAPPASAKVAFTGYGDLRFTAYGWADLGGSDPSVLTTLGVTRTHIQTGGFTTENVGLFATTNVAEDLDFLMDITYRRPGNTASEIRVQYAYLEYRPWEKTRFRGGRINLPFGFINERQFYAFQRVPLAPPFFHNSILGLPMADSGVSAQHRFEAGPLLLSADLYAVNGYGSQAGSTAAFRSATLPGSVSVAANLGRTNNNDRLAYGARLTASPEASPRQEAGVSYYRGEWDQMAENLLQLSGAHALIDVGPAYFLVEGLRMDVDDDNGFIPAVGKPDYHTTGVFAKLVADDVTVRGKALKPYAAFEDYVTEADSGGTGREQLRNYALGVAVQHAENVTLKFEISRLDYRIPVSAGKLDLKFDTYGMGIAFTF